MLSVAFYIVMLSIAFFVMLSFLIFSVFMLSVECIYAEYHFAECRIFIVLLSVVMLKSQIFIVMLNVIMLSVSVINAITPSIVVRAWPMVDAQELSLSCHALN